VTHYANEELPAVRAVPWTLRDCAWAGLPAAVLFGLGGTRRLLGLSVASGAAARPGVMIAAILLTAAAWLVPVYVIAIRKRGGRLSDLGFTRAPWGKSAASIFIAFVVTGSTNVMWALVSKHFHFALQPNMLKIFGEGWRGLVQALMLGSIVAPIAEEVFFRGFLFAGLWQRCPFWISAGGSGLIFAVVHLVPGAILPIGVLGFLLAWLREQTGSIWPSIVMHALNNMLYFAARFAVEHLPRP
jgi:uncharacterized protein